MLKDPAVQVKSILWCYICLPKVNLFLLWDKIAETAKTHVFQSQCHSPVGEI